MCDRVHAIPACHRLPFLRRQPDLDSAHPHLRRPRGLVPRGGCQYSQRQRGRQESRWSGCLPAVRLLRRTRVPMLLKLEPYRTSPACVRYIRLGRASAGKQQVDEWNGPWAHDHSVVRELARRWDVRLLYFSPLLQTQELNCCVRLIQPHKQDCRP